MDIFHNRILWITVFSNLLAQVFKVLSHLISEKKFNIKRALETGGMPSSHASSVTTLATCIGLEHGFNSSLFTISVIFALVVLFDASGVRQAAGRHAEVLNSIMQDLQHLFKEGFQYRQLKTLLGHTRLQVLTGALLGILIAIIMMNYIWVING